jgi:NADH-quinone oxidoreductase subunit L
LIGGFWSKEGIIANAWQVALKEPIFMIPAMLILICAGMTGFYMSRMWFMTFAGEPKTEVAAKVKEQTAWIPIPLVVLTFVTLGGIIFAGLHSTNWLGDSTGGHFANFFGDHGIVAELGHAFANHDIFFFILTYVTIGLSSIFGPMLAMALYGGSLDEGQKAKGWMQWLINLNSQVKTNFHFDNSAWANSSLSRALDNRLYFDAWYDAACLKLVVGLANMASVFDRKVIDGAVKGIESSTQAASSKVRSLTTGSARDYIMMAALGTLAIFILIWGAA